MRIYIAGKLTDKIERERVEKLDILCKKLGFDTFLPHRDVGLAKGIGDVHRVFKGDIIDGLAKCDAVLVSLEGLHIGAGTAWELGYAHAKGLPIIGIKTDEPIEDALDYLSPIVIASARIVNSIEALKKELKTLIK